MVNRQKGNKKRTIIKSLSAILVIAIVAALGVVAYRHFHDRKAAKPQIVVQGAKSQPGQYQSTPSSTNSSQQGGATDENGKTTGTLPPSSEWASSSSGDITLQQPINNSVLASGDTISGTAKVSTVQFILTDNSVGQIAQGTLSVVNGKFSGTLQFTPHATSGKLQVYYPNPSNGAEEDIININVDFNAQ